MKRLVSTLLAAAVAAVVTFSAAAPANAAQLSPNKAMYAAVGDSFAAGTGNVLIASSGLAMRSSSAYGVVLAGDKLNKLTFVADSGATTASVIADQVPLIPKQAVQVTVTVGGNDAGFATLANTCVFSPADCAAAVGSVDLPAVGLGVADVIAKVQEQAPKATIYVTGYPRLFQYTAGCAVAPLAAVTFDAGAVALNSAIQGAVTTAHAAGAKAVYVDVTEAFDGHGVCFADSWLTGLDNPAPLHPNVAGQQAYATAIVNAGFVK